jgi:hypothetical protein
LIDPRIDATRVANVRARNARGDHPRRVALLRRDELERASFGARGSRSEKCDERHHRRERREERDDEHDERDRHVITFANVHHVERDLRDEQTGIGAQAIGQGVWRARSSEYFAEVSEEITELFDFRAR